MASDGRIRWGILTNGTVWRLYDYRARPRASGYYEADLTEFLRPGREADLRVFHLLFRREAFTPAPGGGATFLEVALAEGRRYEEQVAHDLSSVVFERVFPSLVQALAQAQGGIHGPSATASLSDVRDAGLIFLYRLLFVLYAEDRGLLPVNDSRYDDYGLRKRVRDDVAQRMANKDAFSSRATHYYDHLRRRQALSGSSRAFSHSGVENMRDSARYAKIVEWSEEDQCYAGSAPGLIFAGCHGEDEKVVSEQLCQVIEEAIELYRKDGKPLPPATSGCDFANRLQSVV